MFSELPASNTEKLNSNGHLLGFWWSFGFYQIVTGVPSYDCNNSQKSVRVSNGEFRRYLIRLQTRGLLDSVSD